MFCRQGASGVKGSDMSTDTVVVSEHVVADAVQTFHNRVGKALDQVDDMSSGLNLRDPNFVTSRIDKVAHALFYTYAWGWYTLLIEMPYFSIQGLISSPPVSLSGSSIETSLGVQEDREVLQRYILLASLFANEDDEEFETKNFGYLTPQEALEEYTKSYDSRFNGYLGRALGRFITLIPNDRYR